MSVRVRLKGKRWFVFINHHGKRIAQSVGTKAAADKVCVQLQARLALGDLSVFEKPKAEQAAPTFG